MNKSISFSVYVLVKNKKPIYVGCTNNIKIRLSKHRLNKDFDEYIIIKKYATKKEALIAENSIIRFISLFGDDNWKNSKDFQLHLIGHERGFNNNFWL
jgi:hypothetical protein